MTFQPSFFILGVGNDLITSCKVLEFSNDKSPFKILKTPTKQNPKTHRKQNQSNEKTPNTLCKTYHECVYIATGRLYRCEPVNNGVDCFFSASWLLLFKWIALAFRIRSNVIQTSLFGRISKIKTNSAPCMCCLNGSSSRAYLEQHQFS